MGFTDYSTVTMTMTISEQHGRIFSGYTVFTENGTKTRTPIAGIIGRDGRTISTAERYGVAFDSLKRVECR